MLDSDRLFREKGFGLIAGVDEAGRGPLAGPVVAAAVVLFPSCSIIDQLDDSKKLSSQRRERLFKDIKRSSLSIGVGIIDEEVIDRLDIVKATHLAMVQALGRLKIQPELVLIDGPIELKIPLPQIPLVDGDALSPAIAAASIIAKVVRDRIMDYYHKLYPEYRFCSNKGYPTTAHISAIERNGICPVHRRSFRPLKDLDPGKGPACKHEP